MKNQLRSLRSIRLAVTSLVLLAACSDADEFDPIAPDVDFVTPAEVNGTWRLTFSETCRTSTPAAPVVEPSLPPFFVTVQFRDDGQTNTVGSFWIAVDSFLEGAATGQIRFSDGHVDLQLWGMVNQFDQSAMLISGKMTANDTFSGVARDPAPGFVPIVRNCDYLVVGRRRTDGMIGA